MTGDFVRVASTADLEACGGAMKVLLRGKGVAVFTHEGVLYAVQNACPHRGAPLVGGQLYPLEDGLFVVCPDHAWRFRLTDGICPEAGPECTLLMWDVKVEGEDVLLSRLPRMSEGP